MRNAPTALLWAGLSLSALGDQLYALALAWVAVGVLGPYAGSLSALNAGVVLLAVLGIGRWADRWDARRSMIGADLARAAVLALVVLAWLAAGGPRAPDLVVAVVALALGQAIFQPALQAVLPGVVADRALLPAANGLLDATERSARLLGPGLVGVLAAVVPVVHFLTIDALSFLASAMALALIGRWRPAVPAPRAMARGPGAGPLLASILASILGGVRAMRGHRLLGYVLTMTGPINGAWYAVYYLGLPLLIEQRGVVGPGGSGLGAYGLVISAYGCTNLAATLVFGGRDLPARPQWQMCCGNLLTGLGMALIGLVALLPSAAVLPGFAGAAALSAIGGPMKDIPMAVLRQTRLDPADMAPAMRAYMALTQTGVLVAMLAVPPAMATLGVAPLVVACGLLVVLLGATGLWRLADHHEPAIG